MRVEAAPDRDHVYLYIYIYCIEFVFSCEKKEHVQRHNEIRNGPFLGAQVTQLFVSEAS